MATQAIQDYLKAIYLLEPEGEVSTNELAKALNLAPASVTNMLKRLAELSLVHYKSHRGVRLTAEGLKMALEILRHHRLLELYLWEKLGYPLDRVHDEAEHLEHHISEEFEARIAELLGHPEFDPHGDPIPTLDGQIPYRASRPLHEVCQGERVEVFRVSDRDGDLLRYLMSLGLMPKTEVVVLEVAPFEGPITLQIGDKQHAIGRPVAQNVFVSMNLSVVATSE